jgi:malate/lactate dehydrogenase
MDTLWKSRKVVIVGAGAVGSTFAYALAQKGLAEQICLIDANPDFAEGQALDLAHGLPFYPSVQIRAGDRHYGWSKAGSGRIALELIAEKRRNHRRYC